MKLEVGQMITVKLGDGEDEDVRVVNLFDSDGDPCTPDQAVFVRVGPDRNGRCYEFARSLLTGRIEH